MLSPEEEREEEEALQQIAEAMEEANARIYRENCEALRRAGLPITLPPIPDELYFYDWTQHVEAQETAPGEGLSLREAELFSGDERKPTLVVIAGPNGSGKTSLTEQCLKTHHHWLEGCHYINPDTLARERFGDWNDPSAVLKAAQLAEQWRWEALEQHQSLAFETVFSSPEKMTFLEEAKTRGYFIRFLFVGTESPLINVQRITLRTLKGGHSVDIQKVITRYNRAMQNAQQVLSLVDRAYFYDNSITLTEGEAHLWKPLFRTEQGMLCAKYARPSQRWAQPLYDALKP